MAKKKPATIPLAVAATNTNVPLIVVPPGGTLTVVVDVGPMTIPYAVAYAGNTIIKSLVDRAKQVQPLLAGDQKLAWTFMHTEKGWSHAIGFSINGGAVQLLERMSEAHKDPDHSIGFAIVRV
jgi:hypothetical protein